MSRLENKRRNALAKIWISELCLLYECNYERQNIADFRSHSRTEGGFRHDDVGLPHKRQHQVFIQQWWKGQWFYPSWARLYYLNVVLKCDCWKGGCWNGWKWTSMLVVIGGQLPPLYNTNLAHSTHSKTQLIHYPTPLNSPKVGPQHIAQEKSQRNVLTVNCCFQHSKC